MSTEMTDQELERAWWHSLQTARGILEAQDRAHAFVADRLEQMSSENRDDYLRSKVQLARAWEQLEHDFMLYMRWSARLPIGGDTD